MPRLTHAQKQMRGLAGEFLVAGELLRRDIAASVTYGNAKKADVVALAGERAVVIEVKTTAQVEWVLGNSLPKDDTRIWVLVHLPDDSSKSPIYFIATGSELNRILRVEDEAYRARFRARRMREYTGTGVVKVGRIQMADGFEGAWQKVVLALG